ncbi:hypothetical protein [Nocardia sp. GTS18]|nr:hypothetical protein [Nocardia sp. GTS18]
MNSPAHARMAYLTNFSMVPDECQRGARGFGHGVLVNSSVIPSF